VEADLVAKIRQRLGGSLAKAIQVLQTREIGDANAQSCHPAGRGLTAPRQMCWLSRNRDGASLGVKG
jgi:hypothetical protein